MIVFGVFKQSRFHEMEHFRTRLENLTGEETMSLVMSMFLARFRCYQKPGDSFQFTLSGVFDSRGQRLDGDHSGDLRVIISQWFKLKNIHTLPFVKFL